MELAEIAKMYMERYDYINLYKLSCDIEDEEPILSMEYKEYCASYCYAPALKELIDINCITDHEKAYKYICQYIEKTEDDEIGNIFVKLKYNNGEAIIKRIVHEYNYEILDDYYYYLVGVYAELVNDIEEEKWCYDTLLENETNTIPNKLIYKFGDKKDSFFNMYYGFYYFHYSAMYYFGMCAIALGYNELGDFVIGSMLKDTSTTGSNEFFEINDDILYQRSDVQSNYTINAETIFDEFLEYVKNSSDSDLKYKYALAIAEGEYPGKYKDLEDLIYKFDKDVRTPLLEKYVISQRELNKAIKEVFSGN